MELQETQIQNYKKQLQIFCLLLLLLPMACNNDDEILEIPVSDGAILDINVGGPTQPNQVFVDLSSEDQTIVNKANWDIGFYSGNDFVVIINAASEVMARSTQQTDISQVEESDYEEFAEQLSVDAIFSNLFNPPPYPDWLSESPKWIDNPNGDFNDTAINKISEQDSDNDVYYLYRGLTPTGDPRGQYLVQITRNGSGYKLAYRIPGETEVRTESISKEDGFNFVYFNFDNGIISIEPEKESWDIAFTTYMERLDIGGGLLIPYRFQDYVIQNRDGVRVATKLLGETEDLLDVFNNFTLDESMSLVYMTELNSIGSTWRTVASPTPGSVTGVKTDMFYVVKDSNGNVYKLMFTRMLNTEGERGYPQILYKLLK